MNPWDPQSARVYPDDGVWHSLNANENGGQSRDAGFCLQGNGIDRADTAGCNGSGWRKDVSYTLNTIDRPAVAFKKNQIGVDVYNQSITGEVAASLTAASGDTNTSGPKVLETVEIHQNASGEVRVGGEVAYTISTNSNPSGRNTPMVFTQNQRDEVRELGDVAGCLAAEPGMKQQTYVYDARGNGDGKVVPTITGDHQSRVTDYTAICVGNGQLNQMSMAEQANTLDTMHDQQMVLCTAIDCRNGTESNVNGTLQAKSNGGTSLNLNNVCRQNQVVRRLTPLECERLQGFPDGWTDIGDWVDSKGKRRKTTDSTRYRALGNSIALPFWQWLARRICAQYERTVTMGSLFDGIAGFPLVFSRSGAVPVWTSEIEEFPVAVVKKHFGDEGAGIKGDFYGSVNGE